MKSIWAHNSFEMNIEEIQLLRKKHIGGNLSISYNTKPLHIVKGEVI